MKSMSEKHFAILRRHMVEVIGIYADLMKSEIGKEVLAERVTEAMRQVPRHRFVPAPLVTYAYHDTPLPIGFDKTVSQPWICALMTDLLDPQPRDKVLEIGTGLGYQAAILSKLAAQIWSVEIIEEFSSEAEVRLRQCGYSKVELRVGDGTRGWAEHKPFDKILVTAAAERPPPALIDQLRPGGRLVLPIGLEEVQCLTVIDKDAEGRLSAQEIIPVRFSRLETVV
jgi:protein-L-isoaspartate(D-aspartate) O-methyltransferase